jgi:hypothetical protein
MRVPLAVDHLRRSHRLRVVPLQDAADFRSENAARRDQLERSVRRVEQLEVKRAAAR